MAEVYRGWDARLHRPVAIKVLPRGGHNPEQRSRFLQEARAVSALNHPNIVTIHDIGSDQGIDFLVLEYLAGQTLLELVRTDRLQFTDVIEYGARIADALEAAHRAGI